MNQTKKKHWLLLFLVCWFMLCLSVSSLLPLSPPVRSGAKQPPLCVTCFFLWCFLSLSFLLHCIACIAWSGLEKKWSDRFFSFFLLGSSSWPATAAFLCCLRWLRFLSVLFAFFCGKGKHRKMTLVVFPTPLRGSLFFWHVFFFALLLWTLRWFLSFSSACSIGNLPYLTVVHILQSLSGGSVMRSFFNVTHCLAVSRWPSSLLHYPLTHSSPSPSMPSCFMLSSCDRSRLAWLSSFSPCICICLLDATTLHGLRLHE